MNCAIIGMGSNIEPEKNIQAAKEALTKKYYVLAESRFQTTKPVGNIQQPDFINGALLLETELEIEQLKEELKAIESALERHTTHDRYGPRTIDLDLIVWNGTVTDKDFYTRDFLKQSALELIPDLTY